MAEFKLGRLRFVWKGVWASGTDYVKDDVVRYGGKTYVCLLGNHATSNFNTDLGNGQWSQMSDGISWRDTWHTSRTYAANDIVKFGAKDYICLVGHDSSATDNSGFYDDLANGKWSLMTDGIRWIGTWSNAGSTFYKIGDIVKNGAKDYICLVGHTASSGDNGFYTDLNINNYWTLVFDGLTFYGVWAGNVFYRQGDLVKYGGMVYQCREAHTSDPDLLEPDIAKWIIFVPGFDWKGSWADSIHYKINDVVKYGADEWLCREAHTSNTIFDTDKFALFVQGLEFQNSWNSGTRYIVGDVVTYGGYVYQSKTTNNLNNVPSTDTTDWALVTTGFNLRGVWSASASPTYKVGDVVSYGAYVYVAKADNADTNPSVDTASWTLITQGISWKGLWTTGSAYKLGDAITYASNSYIVVQAHTSATGNRPDNDLSGTYWNPLTQGAASNVTTTRGDLIYYSAVGNARLPIGTDGQVLKVVGSDPVWSTVNQVGNVYYVAPTGTDGAGYGSTLDKPWKTIRYACQQVASGPANPSAQYLLTSNKAFIGAEVNNFLAYTYKASVTGTSGSAFLTSNTQGLTLNMPVTFANLSAGNNYTVGGVGVTTTPTTATQTYASQSLTVNSSSGTTIVMSANMTGVVPNQIITFATSFGNVVAGVKYYVFTASSANLTIATQAGASQALVIGYSAGLTITATVAGAIGVGSTTTLTSGQPVTFTGTGFGTLSNSTQYYVSDVLSATLITLSTTNGGPVLASITAATGTLTLVASVTYYVKTITNNTSFTLSLSYGGGAASIAGTGTATATLSYSGLKTARDAGDVLDAMVFDIGRGGNLETVVVTRYYYSGATTYISSGTQYLIPQFVAALNYLGTLATTAVMVNSAPSNNYQTLNGVASSISQNINGAYSTEDGTTSKVSSLISVITTGLSAGTTAAIPAPTNPNTTIYVKTGTYSEIIPISVPAFTALVGDELRTSVVQPYTFTATASSASGNSLVLSSASGVIAGMGIVGHVNIPDGTYVVSISGNTLTLNQGTTGNVTGTVTIGYNMSNMFYMRNGTGARNMSVTGLSGALSTSNAYGTKRPTGGVYFSLDPGTGVQDETVWITTRSPYVQNVSLFGTACIGAKIDGALHAGGNKSMTLNDFTNILSDGLAIWCTNLGLVEAVSVFSYYGYAGYLSELGGKIRATNGNSSYGTYGCLAEGGNPAEVAITGSVNTHATPASVSNVLIGGGSILWLEYANAGQTYTAASYNVVSSTGVSANVGTASLFNNAITEVRIVSGGNGYLSAVNNAQTGTSTVLTLSAADAANTAAYNGERIVLTDGTGAGQYGFVGYYNGGTKNAIICKESFTTITTTSCTTTTFTTASTASIPVGSPIIFQGTTFGGTNINSYTVYYVIAANFTGTTFSVATTQGAITPLALTAGSGTMNIQLCGWDSATGASILANLDFTSKYIIEPRVTFTSGTGSGAFVRAKVLSGVIVEFRVINPGSGYLTTPTIVITDANATSPCTTTVRIASGVLGQPTWTNRGTGYKDAQVVISGNGYADVQPVGYFVYLQGLTALPVAGANLVFAGNSTYYTLVQTLSTSGSAGNYGAYVQVNPGFNVTNAPQHNDATTATIQYSQVRLTGHDFLYVGSGNFGSTGYPNNFSTANKIQANEAVNSYGGRVFFTSTDQDGNFRVGGLFTVQQATGVATLNANLFNLSGLNALQFAAGGASISQFSTDGTFSANSDAIVPTQRAIKTFLASQLGAGGAILAVSSLTAGNVIINANQITTQNSVDLIVQAGAGQAVRLPTATNITATATVTNTGTLVINGTGTQNATPTNPTDIVPKKYVDRVLSLNTMWTNAW